MKSYVLTEFGKPLAAIETPTPQPKGSEVLLKTLAAGVCHSDLHLHDGYYELGGGKRFILSDRGIKPPITMGHEIAGAVAAVGPEAKGVRPGDHYVAYPWIGCGSCAMCRSGNEQLCSDAHTLGILQPGGYADYVIVPHPRYLYPLGRLSPQIAAPYACSGLTTYAALKRIGAAIYTAQPILIFGAGGLGLMCVKLLTALGGKGAIVAELDAKKREAALAAGALAAVDPRADKPGRAIRAAAGGPVVAAIDLVGSNETARLGTDVLARGGKYVIVGLMGGELTLSLPLLPIRSITIEGMLVGPLADFREVMHLAVTGRVEPMPLVERPLAAVNETLEDLRAGRIHGRAMLTP
jgi:D-arabinose 1-dehydrogenase-like Zn-dependent alcohol dehydrogenase